MVPIVASDASLTVSTVLAPTWRLDDTRRQVGRRDAQGAEVDQVLRAAVPPVASKLLMMSAPKPTAL